MVEIGPEDSLLPATNGHEPDVFSDKVSGLGLRPITVEDRGLVAAFRVADATGSICAEITIGDLRSSPCFDPELVRTGLAFGAFRGPDGVTHVLGVVPDEVTTIRIAGIDVIPLDNFWHYIARDGDDLSFVVESSTGAVAKLG